MHNGEVPQKSTSCLHGYLFKGCGAGTYSGDICHRALPIKSVKNWRIEVSGSLVHMGLDFNRFLLLSRKSLVRDWGEKRLVSPLCSVYHVQANLCSSLYWKDPCLGIQALQLWLTTAWGALSADLWTTLSWGMGSSQCTEGQDCDSEGPVRLKPWSGGNLTKFKNAYANLAPWWEMSHASVQAAVWPVRKQLCRK